MSNSCETRRGGSAKKKDMKP